MQLAFGQAPEVEVVAEPPPQEVLGVQPVLDHRRGRPLRRDGDVVVEVPPHVVGEVLLAPVRLPGAGDLEGVVVDQRHPSRAVAAVGAAQVGHEDAAGPAVHGVRAGVAGLGGELLGLDGADDLRLPRVGLGVEHVGARRPDARHDQVTALERAVVGVALVAERAGAGVPPEVVQLVARGRQLRPADHLAVGGRAGVAVDHGHGVALRAGRVERRDVGELLGRRGDGGGGRPIERGVHNLGHGNLLSPAP